MRVSRRGEFQPDKKWRGCTANEIQGSIGLNADADPNS